MKVSSADEEKVLRDHVDLTLYGCTMSIAKAILFNA